MPYNNSLITVTFFVWNDSAIFLVWFDYLKKKLMWVYYDNIFCRSDYGTNFNTINHFAFHIPAGKHLLIYFCLLSALLLTNICNNFF